jgi:hypothetical protein
LRARLRAVERRLRNEVLLEEFLVGVERFLGERQLRLRRLELPLTLDELRVEVGRVDAHQHLTCLHGVAFAHGDLANVARDLRLHGSLAYGLHGPGHRQPAAQRRRLDHREIGRCEFERDRRLVVVFAGFRHFLDDAHPIAPETPPKTNSTTKATMTRRRVRRTPMTSPYRCAAGRSAPRHRLVAADPVWMRRATGLDSAKTAIVPASDSFGQPGSDEMPWRTTNRRPAVPRRGWSRWRRRRGLTLAGG